MFGSLDWPASSIVSVGGGVRPSWGVPVAASTLPSGVDFGDGVSAGGSEGSSGGVSDGGSSDGISDGGSSDGDSDGASTWQPASRIAPPSSMFWPGYEKSSYV